VRVDHEALLGEPFHHDVGELVRGDRVLALRGVLLARQDRRLDGRGMSRLTPMPRSPYIRASHSVKPIARVLGHRVADRVGDHQQAGRRRDV
jgi:hypothetical protein